MPNGRSPLWRWTELPRFATFCQDVCTKIGVPYEGAFDEVRWAIENTILWSPLNPNVTHRDPRFDDDRWRYFRTVDAPARMNLPPLVVTFRVVSYPQLGELGVIEGREVWIESELREIGLSLETDEPAA